MDGSPHSNIDSLIAQANISYLFPESVEPVSTGVALDEPFFDIYEAPEVDKAVTEAAYGGEIEGTTALHMPSYASLMALAEGSIDSALSEMGISEGMGEKRYGHKGVTTIIQRLLRGNVSRADKKGIVAYKLHDPEDYPDLGIPESMVGYKPGMRALAEYIGSSAFHSPDTIKFYPPWWREMDEGDVVHEPLHTLPYAGHLIMGSDGIVRNSFGYPMSEAAVEAKTPQAYRRYEDEIVEQITGKVGGKKNLSKLLKLFSSGEDITKMINLMQLQSITSESGLVLDPESLKLSPPVLR